MRNNYPFKLCLVLFLSLSRMTSAQQDTLIPLNDAIKYVTGDSGMKARILYAYSADLDSIKENKFIHIPKKIEKFLVKKPQSELNAAQFFEGTPLNGPLIDALGTVIAERFKEELTLAFLESFREKLKFQPYLGTLFENAKNVLLNDDPFNHKVWLTSFRGALDEDLRALPENIPELLKEIKNKAGLNAEQISVLKTLIVVYTPALEFAKNPEKSYSTLVKFLNNIKSINTSDIYVTSALTISYILVKELGNINYEDWSTNTILKNVFDPEIAKTFIGFTLEKHKSLLTKITLVDSTITLNDTIINKTNLYAFLTSFTSEKINYCVNYLYSIVNHISSISETVNRLKTKSTKSELKYGDYASLIQVSLETIETLTDSTFLKQIYPRAITGDRLKDIVKYANWSVKFASNINSNIGSKEYSKIVVNTLSFIREFIPQDKLDKSNELKEFVKYADLAINLVGATTSAEMVTVIEGAILPTQSYRLKRNSYFSVSINSYAGVFCAWENLTNSEAKNKGSAVTGFTAPIGVGLNWGIHGKKNPAYGQNTTMLEVSKNSNGKNTVIKSNYFKGHSLSLFASIVDVGAISTFRLANDETPVTSIQWQNIFAPGAYLTWGIGNSPLALKVGAQYGPELRKVTSEDGVATPTINSSAWRFGISLTVDIPFFYLYAKTEKVKIK